MIDLLYVWNKNKFKKTETRDHLIQYNKVLSEITANHSFDSFIDDLDTDINLYTLIANIRTFLINSVRTCSLSINGVEQLTNVSFRDLSRFILNWYVGKTSIEQIAPWLNEDQRLQSMPNYSKYKSSYFLYIIQYFDWIASSADVIFKCIYNDSSCSDIELVGVRTKDYLKELKLNTIEKRFGTPNSRNAYPLSFHKDNFLLNSPPMTTRTYSSEVINLVYSRLKYPGIEKIKIPKTYFIRSNEYKEIKGSFIPVPEYMQASNKISHFKDINPSFLYDFFVYFFNQNMTNIHLSLEDVFSASFFSMSEDSLLNNVYFRKVCNEIGNEVNIVNLINLVY